MTHRRSALCLIVATLATGTASSGPADAGQRASGDKKPSVALKVTPPLGFAPMKVRATVDLKGGSNDYADYYCASVEWDWADGTVSSSNEDCEPYEAGKSTIQRRFTAEHTFRQGGEYDIAFRLKQKNRVVALSKTLVRVRSGIDENFD